MSVPALLLHTRGERLTAGLVLSAWRDITRNQIAVTFLLGFALFVCHLVFEWLSEGAAALAMYFALEQIKAFAMLLAFVVADRVTGRDPDRLGVYAFAVAVGAAAGGAAVGTIDSAASALLLGAHVAASVGIAVYVGLEQFMLGSAAVLVINDRRRARRAREILHRAEIDRIAAEKRSVESDLQAMQARVEPQFLFGTLAQVRALYRDDAARGAHVLDELIAYLRAAMPRMRDSASTLGQEIELVRAYLEIVRLRLGDSFELRIASAAEIAALRMPAMMLLPLVAHATAQRDVASGAKRTLSIEATASDTSLRLAIGAHDDGLSAPPEGEDIAGIRERLAALYGDSARLALRSRADGWSEAVIEIPIESSPASPSEKDLASGEPA